LPQTVGGRILLFGGTLLGLIALAALVYATSRYLLHDDRFRLASASSIQLSGQQHIARAELMAVFANDAGRNVFSIPLNDRRAQLEAIPWVEHATVMRQLPNRLRIAITERRPVAFTRDGSSIGLVDSHGVLMPMPNEKSQGAEAAAWSLPVVIGVTADISPSTRVARMQLFNQFVADLDSAGPPLSRKLSEVDLTAPEDIKALVPEEGLDVLVHFGNQNYLDRFHNFEDHLPEWRQQYPHLASADMRYDRQVVLDMGSGESQPDAAVPAPTDTPAATPPPAAAAPPVVKPAAPVAKPAATVAKPAQPSAAASTAKPTTKLPVKASAKPAAKPAKPAHKPAAKPSAKSAAKPAPKSTPKPPAKSTHAAAPDETPMLLPSITPAVNGKHSAAHPLVPASPTGGGVQ
jgi:cell division protein FtsQ